VRVDNNVYAILGSTVFPSESDGANLTSPPPWLASANITNTMVTPTRTTLTATAGPMQVNLTILNPVEVHFQSLDPFDFHLRTLQARRLGQAIDTVLIPFSHCNSP